MLSPAEILGPSGRIAARLDHYEQRREQLEMADAVADAMATAAIWSPRREPASARASPIWFPRSWPRPNRARPNRKRIIISTHTISLQEQLIDKDMPFCGA